MKTQVREERRFESLLQGGTDGQSMHERPHERAPFEQREMNKDEADVGGVGCMHERALAAQDGQRQRDGRWHT